jgi:hypothetical protein
MNVTFTDLLSNVLHALRLGPPNYPRSLLGGPSSWLRNFSPETELQLAEPWHFPLNLGTARRIALPSWPGRPSWVPESASALGLFRESAVLPYPMEAEPENPYPRESWLLANGICTDDAVLELNARYLHRLFGRPLTLLHNQTYGAALDLAECAFGKGWLASTEAVRKLFPAFYAELKRPDIDRVVLLAHSQGTILAAIFVALLRELLAPCPAEDSPEALRAQSLLDAAPGKRFARVLRPQPGTEGADLVQVRTENGRLLSGTAAAGEMVDRVARWLDWSATTALGLPPLTVEELRKLEVYCFATCATDLRAILDDEHPAPYIEHFGNTHDLVARLGMFAPERGAGRTHLGGVRFVCEGGWGHLLNAHYLAPLERQWSGATDAAFTARAPHAGAESRLREAYLQANPPGEQPALQPEPGQRRRVRTGRTQRTKQVATGASPAVPSP